MLDDIDTRDTRNDAVYSRMMQSTVERTSSILLAALVCHVSELDTARSNDVPSSEEHEGNNYQ